MKRTFRDVVGMAVLYGVAVALATLIVSLAWTSLQRPGIISAPERVHRDLADCSADYKAARTGRDSSRVLQRMVKAPAVNGLNTITCRDLLLGQPRW